MSEQDHKCTGYGCPTCEAREDARVLLDPDAIDEASEGDSSLRLFMYREALENRTRRVATLERRLATVLQAATWAHNVHAGEGFRDVIRPYGCVWSRRPRRSR